jgi:flagellar biosynthesis/type III secretory pathway protein FliH
MNKMVYRAPIVMPITSTVAIGNTIYIPKTETESEISENTGFEDSSRLSVQEEIDRGITEGIEKAMAGLKENAQAEADRIIEIAKKSAEQIEEDARIATHQAMEIARRDAEDIKAKALEDGYSEGFNTAKEEVFGKYNKYIDAAAKLLADINARKESYFLSNEAELRATVYVIAEKIIRGELQIHPEAVENIIFDAAKKYRNSRYLKISMADNPESKKLKADATFVKQLIPFIKDIDIQILEDAPEGTIILDDDSEVTDASIPTQLDLLKEILRNTRGNK